MRVRTTISIHLRPSAPATGAVQSLLPDSGESTALLRKCRNRRGSEVARSAAEVALVQRFVAIDGLSHGVRTRAPVGRPRGIFSPRGPCARMAPIGPRTPSARCKSLRRLKIFSPEIAMARCTYPLALCIDGGALRPGIRPPTGLPARLLCPKKAMGKASRPLAKNSPLGLYSLPAVA